MTNVPEIRFKGFTDAWEQQKLGDLIENKTIVEQSDGNHGELYPRAEEFQAQGVPYISASNISTDGNSIDFRSVKYLSPERGGKFRKGVAKNGDVLLAHNATVGPSLRLEMPFDYAVLSTTLTLFRLDGAKMDSGLFLSLLRSRGFQSQLERLMKQTTRNQVPILTQRLIDVAYPPNVTEQAQIGTFFRTLDDNITLHKRKLDGLRELRKGYLQQLFPKAGKHVPRVRFTGFSGEWQERKLGNISVKVAEKNKGTQFNETFTNSAEHGIISQRDFFDKDISNAKNLDGYFIVRPDDFVYNPRISNLAPVGPIKRNCLGRTGVMSPLYYVFRVTEGDCTFIEKYFESIYWHDFMKMNGDNGVRSDRFNIKDSVFEELPVPFPSVAEQKSIGNLFRNLDEQITAQTAKHEQLRQLKAAYLHKMFV